MKVLSLFDGMSCGQIAFKELGIEVEKYYAYEIDKYAIQATQHNFPATEQCGDVFKADFTKYNDIDWLIGGSPCTYWSIAQKNNRETEASGLGWELFSQYVRALHEAKPKCFLYENNKSMSKQIRASINQAFGFEANGINSALVSAQNRQRLYWVGIRQDDGTYAKANIEQPKDRMILLKDILESGMDLTQNGKGFCLTSNYNGAVAWNTIERNQRNMVAIPICADESKAKTLTASYYKYAPSDSFKDTNPRMGIIEPINTCGEKSHPLKAQYYKNGIANFITNNGFDATAVIEPIRIPEYSIENKSRPVEALYVNHAGTGAGSLEKRLFSDNPNKQQNDLIAEPIREGKLKSYINQVYEVKDGKITINGKQYPIKLPDGYYIIRKLTVKECMRLQTVPDWYVFSCISNSQAYKCLGNGWTVEVIKHLIHSTLTNKPKEEQKQLSMFDLLGEQAQ